MIFKLKIVDGALDAYGIFPEFLNYEIVQPVDEEEKDTDALNEEDTTEVVERELLNNENIIKNISFDQTEILYNIMKLYNDGQPFDCDMTASELKFYEGRGAKYTIPVPKILFDVFPQDERV